MVEVKMLGQKEPQPTKVIPSNKIIPPGLFGKMQASLPISCIDLVILKDFGNTPEVLLIRRRIKPEKGKWCLIGGRVLKDERLREAIDRQAKHELGVQVKILEGFVKNVS